MRRESRCYGWFGDRFLQAENDAALLDLADMVVVSAAVVHGLMGIEPTWDKLTVTPHLPADWPWAEAEILYKGQRQRVRVEGTNVNVKALETSR